MPVWILFCFDSQLSTKNNTGARELKISFITQKKRWPNWLTLLIVAQIGLFTDREEMQLLLGSDNRKPIIDANWY